MIQMNLYKTEIIHSHRKQIHGSQRETSGGNKLGVWD